MSGADNNRVRLLKHACRTLIKQGHPEALSAFGLQPPKVQLENLQIKTPSIHLGDTLQFSATLSSTAKQTQELVIDYLLHFKRANGSNSAKVFKSRTRCELSPRAVITRVSNRCRYESMEKILASNHLS